MDLQLLWFALVLLLFTGLFVLEGFDYGVGMLYPWLGRNDVERRILLNTIGPFWLGNEVWMVCGIGALFAAFPTLYAALFSSLYPLLLAILALLVVRGAAIEFRNHRAQQGWRHGWDLLVCATSLLVSLCWGMVLGNIVSGLPLNQQAQHTGGFAGLFNLYALFWGVALVAFFLFYGALFLALRVEQPFLPAVRAIALRLGPIVSVVLVLLGIVGFFCAPAAFHLAGGLLSTGSGLLALIVVGCSYWLLRRALYRRAFACSGVAIVLAVVAISSGLYPHILISTLNSSWSLTLAQTASGPYTLQLISWIIVPLLPFLIAAQIGNYWIFRHRLDARSWLYY